MDQQEITTQEKNTPVTPTTTPVAETPVKEEDINWKKFREDREAERKAKLDAEKRATEKEAEATALKAAMEAILNKPQNNQSDNRYESQDQSDEDIIQKRIDAALEARDRKMAEERRQQEQREYPEKLLTAYKDFNQVCSAENLDYLDYHYPEVTAGYKHMPEGFNKWAAIYQACKRFMPNADVKKDSAKMQANLNKPQSMSASPVTQSGDTAPHIMDDKRRAANWDRMQRIMRTGS